MYMEQNLRGDAFGCLRSIFCTCIYCRDCPRQNKCMECSRHIQVTRTIIKDVGVPDLAHQDGAISTVHLQCIFTE